jgi:hypothetical protein
VQVVVAEATYQDNKLNVFISYCRPCSGGKRMNSGTRMRSPTAVRKLEELQLQSGYDVDFPNKIPDMAALEVASDFLDQMGERSRSGMLQAQVQFVGDPRYQAAVKKRIETLTRELEVGDGDEWSKHERLDHRRRMVELVQRVESAIRKCGYKLPYRPVVGTLPTRDINAQAIPDPRSGTDIVAFETGMFNFTDVLARVVAMSLTVRTPLGARGPVFDKRAVLEHIVAHPGILLDFVDLVFCQTYLGTCQYATKRLLPKGFGLEEIHSRLRDAVDTFVLAHEYGHVILEHLRTQRPATVDVRHRYEFEADEVGMQIMLAAFDPQWAYAGPVLFLTGNAIVTLAEAVRNSGLAQVPNSDTHPSPPERLSKVAGQFSRSVAQSPAQGAIEFAQMVKWLLADLWSWLQFAFEQAHQHGYTQRLPKYHYKDVGGRVKVGKPAPYPIEYLYTDKQSHLTWFLANAFNVPQPDVATVTDENIHQVVEQYEQAIQAALAADFRRRPHLQ